MKMRKDSVGNLYLNIERDVPEMRDVALCDYIMIYGVRFNKVLKTPKAPVIDPKGSALK